jgi:hypothetical protein
MFRWVNSFRGHVWVRGAYRALVGRSEGKKYLGDPGVDGRIILMWIFNKWNWEAWTGLIWFRKETGGRTL